MICTSSHSQWGPWLYIKSVLCCLLRSCPQPLWSRPWMPFWIWIVINYYHLHVVLLQVGCVSALYPSAWFSFWHKIVHKTIKTEWLAKIRAISLPHLDAIISAMYPKLYLFSLFNRYHNFSQFITGIITYTKFEINLNTMSFVYCFWKHDWTTSIMK